MDEKPVISFVPRESFAVYNIMKAAGEQQPVLIKQFQTGNLEPIEWIDSQVTPGEIYSYFVIPVHPEIKLGGEPVQGPQTEIISVEIPRQETPGSSFWDDILDWFRPERPDNDQDDDQDDNRDDEHP